MTLTRKQLNDLPDLRIVQVKVPGWPEKVCIRELDALNRLRLQSNWSADDQTSLIDLLIKSLCDEKGKRLYQDHEKEALGSHKLDALAVLFEAAIELNHMTADDAEQAAKNSAATDGDASGSN